MKKVTELKPSASNYTNVRPSPTYPGTGWANTEFRTYEFTDSVDDDDLYGRKIGGDNASILETSDSRKRRGQSGDAPPRSLQKQFFAQAMTGWENQQLQNNLTEEEKVTAAEVKQKQPIQVDGEVDGEKEAVAAA